MRVGLIPSRPWPLPPREPNVTNPWDPRNRRPPPTPPLPPKPITPPYDPYGRRRVRDVSKEPGHDTRTIILRRTRLDKTV